MFWKHLTFKSKVVAIILLTCGTSLIVACGIFFAYEHNSHKIAMIEKLSSISKIIGANIASAVVFEDRDDARSTLAALSSEKSVTECVIYDRHGHEFARYERAMERISENFKHNMLGLAIHPTKNIMTASSNIMLKNEIIGRVEIHSDMHLFYMQLERYAIITLAIIIGSFLAATLLALRLHRVISDPVSKLIGAAHHISNNKDYSIRVPAPNTGTGDEISTLVATFNQMLENIQERDKSLQSARDNLEIKVQERTMELRDEMNERIKAQHTIEEEKEKAKLYLDIMGGILVALDTKGAITLINRKGYELLEQKEENLIGRDWVDLAIPEKQRKMVRSTFNKIISGDMTTVGYFENMVVTGTGRERLIAWNNTLIHDSAGNITGTLSSGSDITERRQAEESLRDTNARLGKALEQLKHAQEQVIQSERLKALGEMASGIAHDFNNALMPMMGYTNFILHNPDVLNDREDTLSMIKDVNLAAKDAMEVVRRLREFYKPSLESERQTLSLNAVLESAIAMTRPRWKDAMGSKGITVEIKTQFQDIPPIMANETKMHEVMINLILNAMDSMPNGGTVTVGTRREGKWIIAEVRDTGTGMDQHVLQRCFDPFFTTKGGKGTGLGLSIVHGIIRQHDGWVDIASAPGKGTTVRIRLPEATQKQTGPATSTVGSMNLPEKRIHILIVDDEKTNVRMMEKFLQRDGVTVKTAYDGKEGLKLFKSELFDLVITDRSMPNMNGDILATEIRAINTRIPIIMLTGFADLMEVSNETPPGVTQVMRKPITRDGLNKAIAHVLSTT